MEYYAIYLGRNGYTHDKESAKKKGLVVGQKYLVDYVTMGQSHSTVYLEDIGGFNSVMFDYKDGNGNEVHILENPEWNPYLQFYN